MTPMAHTSIRPSNLTLFSLTVGERKHSGAIYPKLPTSKSYYVSLFITPAIPKSIIFIFFSSEFTSTMFYSFKSRWIRLFSWQYIIPFTICLQNILHVCSSSRPAFSTYLQSQPPQRYSIIIATCMFFNVRQFVTFTIFSCFSDFRIYASTKIESISETELILIILIAHFSPECL